MGVRTVQCVVISCLFLWVQYGQARKNAELATQNCRNNSAIVFLVVVGGVGESCAVYFPHKLFLLMGSIWLEKNLKTLQILSPLCNPTEWLSCNHLNVVGQRKEKQLVTWGSKHITNRLWRNTQHYKKKPSVTGLLCKLSFRTGHGDVSKPTWDAT